MRPTLPVLVRILTRKELRTEAATRAVSRPLPGPIRTNKLRTPTLIQELQAEQKRLGDAYPSNIRIEPVLERHVLEKVDPKIRKDFVELMREK